MSQTSAAASGRLAVPDDSPASVRHRNLAADRPAPRPKLPAKAAGLPSAQRLATWDQGRLLVNAEFAETLRQAGLTTFDALMHHAGGEVAKHLIAERPTVRLQFQTMDGTVTSYLKRHAPARLKEYLKPLIRLRWPRIGARPEWEAIHYFQSVGIPTMTPIAYGQDGRESLLLTLALEGFEKLTDWMRRTPRPRTRTEVATARRIVREIANIARTMHGAGLHHQDFYAGHILLPELIERRIHILDLGRVGYRRHLSRIWVVKDLAQLHYSAVWFTKADRLRFLETYLGRPLTLQDRTLIRQISRKADSIRRHSQKHHL